MQPKLTMPGQPASPAPTPMRRSPRITVETHARIGAKAPVFQSTVLNVSSGGALIFTDAKQTAGSSMQIELGPPIFPVSRLVHGIIRHVDEAPDDLVTSLVERGKLGKKKKGYLLGVEFSELQPEDRQTLGAFIKKRAREERQRRLTGHDDGAYRPHTALERTVKLDRAPVPNWAWLLGLLTGAYELVTGIFAGMDDWNVALHVAAALGTFWFVGRITASVWNQLEAWRQTDAQIVAAVDGTEEDLDDILADADSELDLPDDDTDAETNANDAAQIASVPARMALTA